jgi:hypothetical protein
VRVGRTPTEVAEAAMALLRGSNGDGPGASGADDSGALGDDTESADLALDRETQEMLENEPADSSES